MRQVILTVRDLGLCPIETEALPATLSMSIECLLEVPCRGPACFVLRGRANLHCNPGILSVCSIFLKAPFSSETSLKS